MLSGNPDPADSLRLLIDQKRSLSPETTCQIVSDAARWLKAELKGAGLNYSYGRCDGNNFDSYATFAITRRAQEGILILDVRVAEIAGSPYVFADARSIGSGVHGGFPIFSEIASEDGKRLLLHYISDFILGSEPGDAGDTTEA